MRGCDCRQRWQAAAATSVSCEHLAERPVITRAGARARHRQNLLQHSNGCEPWAVCGTVAPGTRRAISQTRAAGPLNYGRSAKQFSTQTNLFTGRARQHEHSISRRLTNSNSEVMTPRRCAPKVTTSIDTCPRCDAGQTQRRLARGKTLSQP